MTSPGPVPTEDEREHAAIVVAHLPISIPDYTTTGLDAAAEVIAQALADQRAKYEAVADQTAESSSSAPNEYPTAYYNGWEDGAYDMARRIREVAG